MTPAPMAGSTIHWCGSPEPTENHQTVFARILQASHATANLVADAHLAAIAIEHGLTLSSADSDFARFSELSWMNPLRPA